MCDEVSRETGMKRKVSLQNNAFHLCSALDFPKNTFKLLSHLILKAIVGNSQASHYYPHFPDEETESLGVLPEVE